MSEELKPFQKVLVRDVDKQTWKAQFFSHVSGEWYCCMGSYYKQCLPYKGNEHLLGSTDNPTPPESPFKFGDKVEVRDDNGSWHKAVYCKTYAKDEARDRFCVMVEKGMLCYRYCRHADW